MLTISGRKNCQLIFSRTSSYFTSIKFTSNNAKQKLIKKNEKFPHHFSNRRSSSFALSTIEPSAIILATDFQTKSFSRTLRGKSSMPPGGNNNNDDGNKKNDPPGGKSPGTLNPL